MMTADSLNLSAVTPAACQDRPPGHGSKGKGKAHSTPNEDSQPTKTEKPQVRIM